MELTVLSIGAECSRLVSDCQNKHRYHISSLGLFGSQSQGNQRKDSDLDILVTFSTTPSLLQFANLQYHLSDLLGIKADLVIQDSLKSNIGKQILTAESNR